jgi:RNA polymerase sigma factor (sigma-70 family)
MDGEDARRAIDAVWRIESARLIAGLARMTGDVGLAEDLAQDALVAALERWPRGGVPDNPGAWLMTTAKNRAIDRLRRGEMAARREEELGREVELRARLGEVDLAAAADDEIEDDLLSLIFTACHPVLATEARVALTLRLVGSLTTAEIARAFLAKESTVAQRIVRAKRTLAEARVPIEMPGAGEREERLASVLEVIYAIFNEGYAASAGDTWIRTDLCEEAMRLGRILVGLAPREPEALGLVALMELQATRFPARTGPAGEAIPLLEQDRSRWDFVLLGHGLKTLEGAEALGRPLGPYALQAAIAACHARARAPEQTDWERIVALYDALDAVTGSPVVRLNRAVAVGMAFGPGAGLELLDGLVAEPALRGYHLLPAARGELLERLGRTEEAAAEFARAAALSGNARERELLQARAEQRRQRQAPSTARRNWRR